jgi:hypothetical protein
MEQPDVAPALARAEPDLQLRWKVPGRVWAAPQKQPLLSVCGTPADRADPQPA